MEYLVDGYKYNLSYKELKEYYTNFIEMNDEEFVNRINEALHLSCIICYLKEIPTYICLSDRGIIHELVHMLNNIEDSTNDLKEIRQLFKTTLKLS